MRVEADRHHLLSSRALNFKKFVSNVYEPEERSRYSWTTEESEFESRQGQEFSFLYVIQTGSGAYPASYPMENGGSFPGSKAARE
jgi:hypothetical protein